MKVELIAFIRSKELLSNLPNSEIEEKEFLSHLSFTFALEGVSRALSHQLVRHRVASFSQQSQRYIEVKRLSKKIVEPPEVNLKAHREYVDYIDLTKKTYENLVEAGVPREDARFVLPNATETSLLMTMDGRSLIHFFGLRLCNRAQWEIRSVAEEMLNQVRIVEPSFFNSIGPYCVQLGRCPEGRLRCGKIDAVKKKYVKEP